MNLRQNFGNFWKVPEMQEIEGLQHEIVDEEKKSNDQILSG